MNVLKQAEIGNRLLNMKKKMYAIGTNPGKRLKELMNLQFFRILYRLSWKHIHAFVVMEDGIALDNHEKK
jgi:hypothetical protein